jgi:cell division protein FtsZ
MSMANGVLVHVSGGDDVTLEEVTRAGELVTRSMPHEIRIIWGARVDSTLKGRARVMIVLTGVETNFSGMSRTQPEPRVVAAEEKSKRKWWG